MTVEVDAAEELDAPGLIGPWLEGEPMRALLCVITTRAVLGRHREPRGYCLDMATADLSLLNSGRAPVLLDHCRLVSSLVGVVERAWTDADACYAVIRFGSSPRCLEVARLVQEGVLTNVSVGTESTLGKWEDGTGAPRATWWRPFEVSLCTVPKDWGARVQSSVPTPRHIIESAAEAAAQGASGSPAGWRAWAAGVGTKLAKVPGAEVAASLDAAMEAELLRLRREATAAFVK